jgi:chloramphenicol-sensitive protein RarD
MTRSRAGAFFALAAYFSWGIFPAYWKLLMSVEHLEILAQRVIWATLFLLFVSRAKLRMSARALFRRSRPELHLIFASASLIGVNWYTYIHAVNSGNVLEASLGYFINPLVNVFLGWALLGEKLSRRQWFSVTLAAAGVLNLTFQGDHFPGVSLLLASTFGLYGLLRKRMKLEPLLASTVESALLFPLALAYLIFLTLGRGPALGHSPTIWLFLVVGGAVTALPLLWFAEAAQRLKFSTLGFFQYIAPSLQFALAVYYGEPFTAAHAKSFACIWAALLIFCVDLAFASRLNPRRPTSVPTAQ